MKVDLFLYSPQLEAIAARARQAEHGGFDGLFVAESRSDPFQALAVASAHVTTVELGTSVALAFPRSPMLTAVSAWDLQRATGGRFILGLGSQVRKHVQRRFSAPFDRPAARLREYTLAVRHIWGAFQGTHPLRHHGEFYELDFLPDSAAPGPLEVGPPVIHLAALGPRMFRVAGEVADGAFVHPLHTTEYLKSVAEPAIHAGLAATDRPREAFALCVTALAAVGEGAAGQAMRERMRAQLAFYASTPAYRPVLELHGWGGLADTLSSLARRGEHAAMGPAVPDNVLDTFCICAPTWDAAIDAARRRYTGIAARVAFHTPPPLDDAPGPT